MKTHPSTITALTPFTLYEIGGTLSAILLGLLCYLGQTPDQAPPLFLLVMWVFWLVATILGVLTWLAAARISPAVPRANFGNDSGMGEYCIPPRRAPGVPDNHHANASDPRYGRNAKPLETDREINRAVIDWEPLAFNLASSKPVFGMCSDDVYGALLAAIAKAAQAWKPDRSSFCTFAKVCVANRFTSLLRSAAVVIRNRNTIESFRLGITISRGTKNCGGEMLSLVLTAAEQEPLRRTNED